MSGRFIALEGLDGSGGTTQAALLQAWLEKKGVTVVGTKEPSDRPVGELIKQALRGEVDLSDRVLPYLFAADRRDHVDVLIRPSLEQGEWVVSDRYLASSLAYQGVTTSFKRVVELNVRFPLPDLTIYLELSPEQCLERIAARGDAPERFEELERLNAVQLAYERALDWGKSTENPVVRIDASQKEEDVAASIRKAVWRYFELPGDLA